MCGAYCKTASTLRKEEIIGLMSGKGGVFRQVVMGKGLELSASAHVERWCLCFWVVRRHVLSSL